MATVGLQARVTGPQAAVVAKVCNHHLVLLSTIVVDSLIEDTVI